MTVVGAWIVRLRVAEPPKPCPSVAVASMAWVPAERLVVEKLAPVPMTPSRLEVQTRPELRGCEQIDFYSGVARRKRRP